MIESFKNRVGIFELTQEILMEIPHVAKQLFGKCVIIEAKQIPERGTVRYVALHNQFDFYDGGIENIPRYAFSYDQNLGQWFLDGEILDLQ